MFVVSGLELPDGGQIGRTRFARLLGPARLQGIQLLLHEGAAALAGNFFVQPVTSAQRNDLGSSISGRLTKRRERVGLRD